MSTISQNLSFTELGQAVIRAKLSLNGLEKGAIRTTLSGYEREYTATRPNFTKDEQVYIANCINMSLCLLPPPKHQPHHNQNYLKERPKHRNV
jgi:hypothetical protein